MTTVLFLGSETWSCRWGVHPFASWSCVTISMALSTSTKHDSIKRLKIVQNWPLTLLWADTHFPFCWQIMFCVCWFHQSRQRPLSPRLYTYWRRASNIPYADLRHIIIVGNMTFLVREWGLLRWFELLICKDYFGHFIIGLLRQFELLMQRLFWTFYYWRTCSETCRRSRLWTETHWTELTSGQ